jgi:hypothetical protein
MQEIENQGFSLSLVQLQGAWSRLGRPWNSYGMAHTTLIVPVAAGRLDVGAILATWQPLLY